MVKTAIANRHDVDKAVFDPAHRKAGSYWQWSSVAPDATWERAAENVHKAWPTKVSNFEDQAGIYFGVLDEGADHPWLYRVYPGGRDSFGRPGRYFFVLFRLRSPDQVLLPEVSGFLNYFDAERGLPLNTAPLDGHIPGREPGDLLLKLHRHWVSGNNGRHWGMDDSGTTIRFAQPSNKATPQPETPTLVSSGFEPQPTRRNFIVGLPVSIAIALATGLLLGAALGNKWGYDRGCRAGTNAVVPPPITDAPVTTNTVQPEPEKSNERVNTKGRIEEQPPGKKSAVGPTTNQNLRPSTNRR